MSRLKNKTGLPDEAAKKIAEDMLEQNAKELRDKLVRHFAHEVIGEAHDVQQLAVELKAVIDAVFDAKPDLDWRVGLLALEYVTQSLAVHLAKQYPSSIEMMPEVTGHGSGIH